MAEPTPGSDTRLQALFPDLPREVPVLDDSGDFSPLWSLGFSSLFQALQENYKNEGILLPRLSSEQMGLIQQIYQPYIGTNLPNNIQDISGQTAFDVTNRLTKQFIITYDESNPPNILFADWIILTMMLLNFGNPNGVLAGQLQWLCYDIENSNLYFCSHSGSVSSAIWVLIN